MTNLLLKTATRAGKIADAHHLCRAVTTRSRRLNALPVLDTDYSSHQTCPNETVGFYNFSNIRYAAPPVRFAPPEAPKKNRKSVNTGNVGRICPQASPSWGLLSSQFITRNFLGLPNNITTPFSPPGAKWSRPVPTPDPRASEDCLFLDVYVPKDILALAGNDETCGAPVLVWIYGGGYTAGEKSVYNPAGLLAASGNGTDGNVIYVALNYRLGAMGFTSGPSFQAEGGVSNLGLLDQRFALEWVQKHIHHFGGDPNRVTVFGESAGGGSIMHQITAYGGSEGPVPFQRAIPQSPGFLPLSSQLQQEEIYQTLLDLTNSTSLEDLRNLSEAEMIKANSLMVTYESPYGSFTYGPAVDGDFVPLQPGQLLAQGRFDKNVSIMVGHNSMEGPYFTAPYINSTEAIAAQVRGTYPYIPEKSLTYITETLYPAVFNGTYGYTTEYERASLLVSESVFTCNTNFLSTAFKNETYSYLFAVPPALHGFDIPYTFYTGGGTPPANLLAVSNSTVAIALQKFIISFAENGVPAAPGVVEFRMYGANATVLELNITDISEVRDTNANRRCDWWQKGLLS
ncbi:alpha/beta-hydrolase [Lojkania enalia]|uniref:Carboxylic ester hydrolase n=1 Tax=Lojkania enalia TaxID=147567 RepID=A0A9P4KBP6_9PLEO|nr:alpha/beta-hydrolase [Didymosphaeria enalia]